MPLPRESLPARIVSVFPQAVASLPFTNHKHAFQSYVRHYGFEVRLESNSVVVRRDGLQVLSACFDEHDRLTRLKAALTR